MTAQAMKGERERCLRAGMDDYVAKPVRPEQIREALLRVLGRPFGPDPSDDSSQDQGQAPERFSPARLDKMLHGDRALIREILDMFLEDTESNLEKLRNALEAGDQDTGTRTAHALKGSAANIGAALFSGICYEMEQKSRSGGLAAAQAILPKARAEFEELRTLFEALTKGT
jgi:HPt (histidine-containing phosphotransfer) domain-containing protein